MSLSQHKGFFELSHVRIQLIVVHKSTSRKDSTKFSTIYKEMKKGWRECKGDIFLVPVKLDDHTPHLIKSLYIEIPYDKKIMSIAFQKIC